ncbi:hypothetical protein B0A48_07123 [Cryoendolithus antarcticus]|uniref:Heterokaryon incompatibility domain-containing protein n=1 Tax=Cryoendolithus antarcticus TaxID=1507870 RepID=A0A1V8T7N6_9PEZI|nr:hypothetical protein B0A48_07123 [Cryoendolithus antarcticus]
MEAIYASQPLDPERRQLRLITINPCSCDELLSCELSTYSLLDTTQAHNDLLPQRHRYSRPLTSSAHEWSDAQVGDLNPSTNRPRFRWGDYAALSYVWGNPDDAASILVNGEQSKVGRNLFKALNAVRKSEWFGSRMKLWIDALCINQQDTWERGHQVGLMRMIYAEAWLVLGFLGPERDGSDLAVDLIECLANTSRSVRACEQLRDKMVQHELPHPCGSWLALARLLNRPYWSRLWIVQELVLGGARAILMCGSRRIEWMMLCRSLSVIHEYLWNPHDEAFTRDCETAGLSVKVEVVAESNASMHVWKDLGLLTLLRESPMGSVKLATLILLASETVCSDDRDKVYGLLGLMDPSIAQRIIPDYCKSAASVYTDTAEAYIAAHHSIEFLRDANLLDASGSPTWVPDWKQKRRCRDHRPDEDVHEAEDIEGLEWRPYCADSGLPFGLPRRQGAHLICHAVLLDTVDGLGCNPEAKSSVIVQPCGTVDYYGSAEAMMEQLAIALYADRRRYHRDSRSILHLPLTLHDAETQFSKPGWEAFARDMYDYARWLSWFDRNANFMVGERELRAWFPGHEAERFEVGDCYYAFRAWIRTALAGRRRLVVTSAGRIGWADCARADTAVNQAAGARRGDIFAVFPGCPTPILLRPMEDSVSYQVVGEAYLQGCMEGEVEGLVRSGQHHVQEVTLY